MKSSKRIAFIFAFPIRTGPVLITMPFGMNVIELLDKEGYEIDVYLSEYRNDSYKDRFSGRVTVHFLDHNYMWPKVGLWSYIGLTSYFRYLCWFKLRGKYSHIFASGMAGITLGGLLKKVNRKGMFVYLNDEFPDQGTRDIWVRSEIRHAQKADLVSTPDESRFPPLCKQIPGLDQKPHFPLPNTPLKEAVAHIPVINWHEKLGIPQGKKLFLMAGGLQAYLQIEDLMESVNQWPDDCVLILKGKNRVAGYAEKVKHLLVPGKIVWSEEAYSPDLLHSLIAYCEASICLYEGLNDNLSVVGKSSGKLMRSILLGKPVIVSKQPSFAFVEELGLGVQVNNQEEIAGAVKYILDHSSELQQNCRDKYDQLSFENYWNRFEKALFPQT